MNQSKNPLLCHPGHMSRAQQTHVAVATVLGVAEDSPTRADGPVGRCSPGRFLREEESVPGLTLHP